MNNRYAFRRPDEELAEDDLDKEIPLLNIHVWGIDKPFKVFIESEPRLFEYEFMNKFPEDGVLILEQYKNYSTSWSHHGRNMYMELEDQTNEDHSFRLVFQNFIRLWEIRLADPYNKHLGIPKLRFYLGSSFFSGMCVPGDICSVAMLKINVEVLLKQVKMDEEWVPINKLKRPKKEVAEPLWKFCW